MKMKKFFALFLACVMCLGLLTACGGNTADTADTGDAVVLQIGGIGTGILGGIVATLGIVCPALIVICIISKFLEKFRNNKFVNYAFYGIRPAVAGLITGAMASVFVSAVFILGETGTISGINIIASAAFVVLTALCAVFKKLHPIVFIALGALVGIIFGL